MHDKITFRGPDGAGVQAAEEIQGKAEFCHVPLCHTIKGSYDRGNFILAGGRGDGRVHDLLWVLDRDTSLATLHSQQRPLPAPPPPPPQPASLPGPSRYSRGKH